MAGHSFPTPPKYVRLNPALAKKNRAWSEIGEIFGLTSNECLGIWKKLRSAFTRYFKTYQASKHSDKPYNPSNWKYFDSLLFVIPYIEFIVELSASFSPASKVQTSQSAATHIAKKALKRSKNLLLKSKDGDDGDLSS